MFKRLAGIALVLAACQSSQRTPPSSGSGSGSSAARGASGNVSYSTTTTKAVVVAKPGPITALPATDLVGYFSGNYRTPVNAPALYADTDRHVFVMAGPRAIAELPFNQPDFAMSGFEAFLTMHGFPANGKPAVDPATTTIKNGEPLVATGSGSMSADIKAHFTDDQLATLATTSPDAGFAIIAAKYPVIWAHADTVTVAGPGGAKSEFSISKASDAFAQFRSMVPK